MVNDCSPYTNNEYFDLRNEIKDKFKLHYYCTSYHGGPAVARQLGLEEAQSDWVMFIDDDDELYSSTAIEHLLTLANTDFTISITGQVLSEGEDKPLQPWVHH